MNERIDVIDVIRGFALFGILVVNILAFSSVWYASGYIAPGGRTALEAALSFVVSALFELKFYLLFSFLFGYSVTLQMQSAEKAATAFLPRMLRRQAGLFAIGAFHAVLLFHGDILTTYAVLGLFLLALRNRSDRALLRLALVLIVVTAVFWLALAALQYAAPVSDETALFTAGAAVALAAWRGGPVEIITQHLVSLADFLPVLLLLQGPCALAMFLAGFVAGRRQIFSRPEVYRPRLVMALRAGLAAGLPGSLFYAAATQFMPGTATETVALALLIVTAPFLTLAMLAALLMRFGSTPAGWLRQRLASAGRMALSGYLLQSLICALIFHGYGLRLVDRLDIAAVLAIAVVIFAVQLVLAHAWCGRFRYGPMEWLLRAVTIGRWP